MLVKLLQRRKILRILKDVLHSCTKDQICDKMRGHNAISLEIWGLERGKSKLMQ